jgi:DNA-binding transcriptional LysR family regulator
LEIRRWNPFGRDTVVHQHNREYIPVELLRALAVIVDTGSFTKAGNILGLTQSAISAQVKRLQLMVGGDIFRKKSGGALILTDHGKIIDRHARRILILNDKLLLVTGGEPGGRRLRIGMPVAFSANMLMEVFKACSAAADDTHVQIQCASSIDLIRNLELGYVDVAMVLHKDAPKNSVVEWMEGFAWTSSPDLLISPGAPIPYISWPDSEADRLAFSALDRAGINYVVTFAGTDFHARQLAVQAGLGFMLLPQRALHHPMKPARERFLPPIERTRAGIWVRDDFAMDEFAGVVKAFESVVKPKDQPEDAIAAPLHNRVPEFRDALSA